MIADLLPGYYAQFGTDPTFAILRSIVADSHETAWMEFRGRILTDLSGQGREGQEYVARQAFCECYFMEGAGWTRDNNGKPVQMVTPDCSLKRAAQGVRFRELRDELSADSRSISEVIDSLITKVKAGEWVENGNGASFYGGWFYLQTLAAVVGKDRASEIHDEVRRLIAEKRFSLTGAILCPYVEPPPPAWNEAYTLVVDGWIGIASAPAHEHMPSVWRLELFRPDGTHAADASEPIFHPIIFGIDVDDADNAERRLRGMIVEETKKEKTLA